MKAAPPRIPSTARPDKQARKRFVTLITCTGMRREQPEATRHAHHFWALLGTLRALQTCKNHMAAHRTEVKLFTAETKRTIGMDATNL